MDRDRDVGITPQTGHRPPGAARCRHGVATGAFRGDAPSPTMIHKLTPTPIDWQIRLPDGRLLAYSIYGLPTGRPVYFFHGFPGSRLQAALVHEHALAHGHGSRGLRPPRVRALGAGPGNEL